VPKSVKSASFIALEKSYGPRHLRLRIILYMAVRNLISRRLRTFLTAGGVLIGIGSITFLVSLGLGLQDLVTRQVIGSKSVTAIDVTPPASNIVHIDGANVSKIRATTGVKDVAKSYAAAGKATFGGSGTDVVIYGADQSYLDLSSLNLITGGRLQLETGEVLVNSSLLKLIGLSNPSSAVGKTVKLDVLVPANTDTGKRHILTDAKIKGVLDTGSGSEIFISDQFFSTAGVTDYAQLKVVAADRDTVPQIRKSIEGLGFNTASPLDTLTQINQVFTFFNFILAGFGGIGMLIAVLGMFNTLTISLLERTREIALMISLGARRRDIRRLFIAEAVALAILGGVAGIASSWLLGVSINILLTQMAHSRGVNDSVSIFSLPWWLVGETLILVVIVALVVVAYPAWRAVRVNPIDALRHE
jgi:putative ABC transport system permease protein